MPKATVKKLGKAKADKQPAATGAGRGAAVLSGARWVSAVRAALGRLGPKAPGAGRAPGSVAGGTAAGVNDDAVTAQPPLAPEPDGRFLNRRWHWSYRYATIVKDASLTIPYGNLAEADTAATDLH